MLGVTDTLVANDFYSFTLAAGDTATVALRVASGTPSLTLQDASGTLLAQGSVGPTNVTSIVTDFTATVAGTYYAVVNSSTSGVAYSLVVTRNAEFDTEPNDTVLNARDVTSRQVAGEQRAHRLRRERNDRHGTLPRDAHRGRHSQLADIDTGGRRFEFVNTLNPRLRVLNATGTQLALDDNSAPDGRNARLTFPVTTTGTYLIEVSSTTATPTVGEYILSIQGATFALPAFQATATIPAAGTVQRTAPTVITVTFNDNVLATSLQSADLTIDGIPATGVPTLSSGNTVNFTVPAGVDPRAPTTWRLPPVQYSMCKTRRTRHLPARTPLDFTGPRVTSTSVPPGAVLTSGRFPTR